MPLQGRLETLASSPGSEMKGLTPAELVEIGHQVVVVIDERLIMLFPALQTGVVDRGVSIDHGLHFIRGEIREGTGIRSFGWLTGHSIILPDSYDLSVSSPHGSIGEGGTFRLPQQKA